LLAFGWNNLDISIVCLFDSLHSHHASGVESLDVGGELILGVSSLHLHGGSQQTSLDGEWVKKELNLLWLLQTVELVLGGKLVKVRQDSLLSLLRVNVSVLSLEVVRVDHNESNNKVVKRVTVNPDLSSPWRLNVHVLKLLGGNVLSLRKFEDVLDSVNDVDAAVFVNSANVTGKEPLAIRKHFCSFLWVIEVSLHD